MKKIKSENIIKLWMAQMIIINLDSCCTLMAEADRAREEAATMATEVCTKRDAVKVKQAQREKNNWKE